MTFEDKSWNTGVGAVDQSGVTYRHMDLACVLFAGWEPSLGEWEEKVVMQWLVHTTNQARLCAGGSLLRPAACSVGLAKAESVRRASAGNLGGHQPQLGVGCNDVRSG